jgi:hypothetical protein
MIKIVKEPFEFLERVELYHLQENGWKWRLSC